MFETEDVDVDSPPARAAGARAEARSELQQKRSTSSVDAAASPEAAVKAYCKLSDMRTSQLQQRMQVLSQRDPRLGVTMVLARSPKATKEQAMRALQRSNGDVDRAVLRLSEPDEQSPDPPPIEMTLPKDIDLDVTPKAARHRPNSDEKDGPGAEAVPGSELQQSIPRPGSADSGRGSESLAAMRQQVEHLEAEVRRLQAIGELEKQEKLILIEDMNTMHQLQKEQIEQDRRHLQQMDETNEQLCQDLIHAEAELTLLRNSRRRESTNAGDTDGDLAATERSTAPTTTTPPRQSSMEIEAALAWEEKAALEALLRDTQKELAELRHPPEPESKGGFFATVFGSSSTKSAPIAVVNDADIHASVTQATSRGMFAGSAASRATEVYRRLQGALNWLQLASSGCSGNETTVMGRDTAAAAGSGGTLSATVGLAQTSNWCVVELSRTLMDLASPGSAILSAEAEAAAAAETAAQISTTIGGHTKSQTRPSSSTDSGKVRVYRILFVLVELSIRCVARTTVRESAEITSAKTGILAVGDEIEAFEEREVPIEPAGTATGSAPMTTVRVRCHLGWVSKIGGVGSRKATQDRQLASSVIRQQGTPILEEIHANPIPEEKRMDEGEVDADSAMVPAHAGLVLGGPYTTDPQVVFCPAIRWQQDQEGRDHRDVKVRWLRRHRPEVEGQASAGDAGSGDWIPIAGANGWSYTPCVTDVDCELQAVVRSGGSSARETRVRPVSDDASLDLVQNAQQVRLNRLTSGRAVQGSIECTGDGVSASRPLCIALSPPLRLDPLIASQVEAWLGENGSGDVSFAVKRANANSRLTIHGKDEMVTLHLGPRPLPDERPVWASPLEAVAVLLTNSKSEEAITLRNSVDGSVGSCTVRTLQLREHIGATILLAQKKARQKAADSWF